MLLMIPGPIEIAPEVRRAAALAPPSHVSADFIAAFGRALGAMRRVWKAPDGAQPFVVAGSGTLAMEMAVCNLLDPGQAALVVDTGYFSDRMAIMLERRGVRVRRVVAEPGHTVAAEVVDAALARGAVAAVFVTHVDTSTGVRADVQGIAAVANRHGAMVVVDGVCATAGEVLDQAADGVDVYLTASQKALGAPPGLALLVASQRALAARQRLVVPPPLTMDFEQWTPIMTAYEEGRASYFATPATSLVAALDVALQQLVDPGVDAVWARHQHVADRMRAAWEALDLELLPASADIAANTLSAIRYPAGVDGTLPGKVAARGVAVAGGLHPKLKTTYFRVGHMGWVTTQPELLDQTVRAVAGALNEAGHACDAHAAVAQL